MIFRLVPHSLTMWPFFLEELNKETIASPPLETTFMEVQTVALFSRAKFSLTHRLITERFLLSSFCYHSLRNCKKRSWKHGKCIEWYVFITMTSRHSLSNKYTSQPIVNNCYYLSRIWVTIIDYNWFLSEHGHSLISKLDWKWICNDQGRAHNGWLRYLRYSDIQIFVIKTRIFFSEMTPQTFLTGENYSQTRSCVSLINGVVNSLMEIWFHSSFQ